MARVMRVNELSTSSSNTHGYCVWFPDYTGSNASSSARRSCNFYIFQTSDANTAPLNTTASPFGTTNENGTSGKFVQDAMFSIASSTLVQDTRCAAGCIRMSYTGRNDELSGRIGYLNNIPREALLTGGSGDPPTVNEMIVYSDHVSRTPMDTLENKFRPTSASQYFRTPGTPSDSAAQFGNDACFLSGVAGQSTTEIASDISSGAGNGIGFIWAGLPPDSSIVLETFKVVEWRPDMASTLVSPPPTVSANGMNVVTRAISWLDHHHPGWQRKAVSALASGAARVAQLAFTGPSNAVVRAGLQMIDRKSVV